MFPARIPIVSSPPSGNTYSLLLDGSDDYVSIADDSTLNFGTGAFTITAWFSQTVNNSTLISKGTYNGEGDWLIYDALDNMEFRNDNNSGDKRIVISSDLLNDGWHHLAVTRNGTALKTYLDGVHQNTGTLEASYDFTNAHNVIIGAREDGADRHGGGNIDEVAIWNKALSAGDIAALYSARGTANLNDDGNSANLQGWWRMGDGTLDDGNISGNGLIADQVNPTLGSEEITNGGATGTTDWVDTDDDGEADGWGGMTDGSIVTDVNGFTGNAQRDYSDGSANIQIYTTGSSVISADTTYKFRMKYRSSYQLTFYTQGGSTQIGSVDANTGDAIEHIRYIRESAGGELRLYVPKGAGRYLEIDEVSLKEVNGNPGMMVSMDAVDIEKDTP